MVYTLLCFTLLQVVKINCHSKISKIINAQVFYFKNRFNLLLRVTLSTYKKKEIQLFGMKTSCGSKDASIVFNPR